MPFFEDDEAGALAIERMVFHLVGPNPDQLVRLEELHPGRFTEFFLERIKSVVNGTRYNFSDASATRERLARIANDGGAFQIESEKLAEDFQRKHDRSSAAGAFLVFLLKAGTARFFALLKYDDEQVLTYEVHEADDGRKRVTLDAIERTFVQNREALQKSALIRLDGEGGGELVVVDRQNKNIARFFENFLDIIRIHQDSELTEKLVKVTRELILANKELVPEDVVAQLRRRTYDAAKSGGYIAEDGHKNFLDTVVGTVLPNDHKLVRRFHAALRRARIDGMPINLDAAKVSPPNTHRYVTMNNIQVRVPHGVEAFVTVEEERIIVNDRVKARYDDAEVTS